MEKLSGENDCTYTFYKNWSRILNPWLDGSNQGMLDQDRKKKEIWASVDGYQCHFYHVFSIKSNHFAW